MNYEVFYQKYRPSKFSEIVEQNAIVKMLKNSIINDKVSHAYIFSGPRGTGKTSTARILAKTLNCSDIKNGEACGECANCLIFNESPDIVEIDAASNNGVDEIREIISNSKLLPISGKYKIYIVDEVHMLTESAFNALLLTLEEPPKHVIFIMATTNLEKVPITVLSRCMKYEFSKISEEELCEHLKKICEKENIKYTEEAIQEIASLADGGLRDALSMLDQLSKESVEINLDFVTEQLGTVSIKNIEKIVEALDNNNALVIIDTLEGFKKSNVNYKVFIKKVVDLLAKKAVNIVKNYEINNLEYEDIKNIILELNLVLNQININVNAYLIIEIILLKYIKNFSKSVEKIETNKEIISFQNQEVKNKNDLKNEEVKLNNNNKQDNIIESIDIYINCIINNCFVSANRNSLMNLNEIWDSFVEKVEVLNLKGLLMDTNPVASSEDYAIFVTNIERNVNDLNHNIKIIEDLFKKENDPKKMVFISEKRWENEKLNYIKNIKNHYKYELKNEQEFLKEESNEKIKDFENESLIDIAKNIFANDKIEIE
ncbi:MAG: DNA polymerase III subunit gamma/tau [Firmicutes bacterium]|nr:DNA polymerase III subunit gamma/tau [Bacillota bacterium]